MNKSINNSSAINILAGLLIAILGTSPAIAAENSADDNKASTERESAINNNTITITATRRTTTIQETAISIQAFAEDALDNLGATNLDDVLGFVPGLVATGDQFTVRGLSTDLTAGRGGGGSTTSRYLDETPIEHNFRLFDVQQIEVLRGPQGTLYGAGAMGGTIRIVTNKPDSEEFSGKVSVKYSATSTSDDNNNELNAMLNIPLVEDEVALRLVGYRHDSAGFIDDVGLGIDDINSEIVEGGRAALHWEVNDILDVSATYMQENIAFGNGPFGDLENLELGELKKSGSFNQKGDNNVETTNLLINLDLDWASAVYSGSHTTQKLAFNADATDFFNSAFAPALGLSPGTPVFSSVYQNIDNSFSTDTHEFRLVSSGENEWDWIVGAFYQEKKSGASSSDIFVEELDPNAPAFGVPVGVISGFSDPNLLVEQRVLLNEEEELAGFGELTYNFNQQLAVTAGIRFLDIKQQNQAFVVAGLFGLPAGVADPSPLIKVKHKDHYAKFRIAYEYSDNLMTYFTRSEGFRRGGFNGDAALSEALVGVVSVPLKFDSDLVTNWELGFHSSWMENRMTFNGAFYLIDWDDVRVNVADPSGFNFIKNGPAAEIKGVELEFQYKATDNLTVTATMALTSAKLNGDEEDPELVARGVLFPDNLTLAPDGEDLPGIPDQTFSVMAHYTIPNLFSNFDGYVRLDSSYTGSSWNTYEQGQFSFLREKLDSYTLTNFRVGILNEDWDISLYAINISDQRADLYIDQGDLGAQSVRRNRPRTIGVNVRMIF